jgi:hypothetical protein
MIRCRHSSCISGASRRTSLHSMPRTWQRSSPMKVGLTGRAGMVRPLFRPRQSGREGGPSSDASRMVAHPTGMHSVYNPCISFCTKNTKISTRLELDRQTKTQTRNLKRVASKPSVARCKILRLRFSTPSYIVTEKVSIVLVLLVERLSCINCHMCDDNQVLVHPKS